jgi:AbrB family looped-hinge helix DNA binding protein
MTDKEGICEMFGVHSHKVEAIVTVDDRGQIVLPKEVREKAEIQPGDKLALISLGKDGKVFSLVLVKAKMVENHIKAALGPLMNEIFRQ